MASEEEKVTCDFASASQRIHAGELESHQLCDRWMQLPEQLASILNDVIWISVGTP